MSVATHINLTSVSYYGKNNKICASILDNICQFLRSAEFIAAHRVNSCDFTRKRCLSPEVLVAFLLQMVGGRSLQVGLDQFFCALGGGTALLRVVTRPKPSAALGRACADVEGAPALVPVTR